MRQDDCLSPALGEKGLEDMSQRLNAAILAAFRSADLPENGRIGVAVSGGSDSLALLFLLAARFPVAAVTVDHGLRSESAGEAQGVARVCAALGVPHQILTWSGPRPQGNLMDQARRARLSLIGEWARAQGIAHVALGHTQDDQAETFMMRLARESGLEGLAGMRAHFVEEGVTWHRPLLNETRESLRQYLRTLGQDWVEDPSNSDVKYERVRVRQALKTMGDIGVTSAALASVVSHLARADAALAETLNALVAAHVTTPMGDVVIDARAFAQAFGPEMQRRVINAALRWVSGASYAPRAAKLEGFLADWSQRKDCTLHGCRIRITQDSIRITRELNAVADLRVPPTARWDRWYLTPQGGAELVAGVEIGALGATGLADCADWRTTGHPRASLLASPALWRGDELLCAPLAGYENGWKAQLGCGAFAQSLFRR